MYKLDDNIPPQNKEDFHEFCRAYTDIFSKNVFTEKDYTYKTLKSLKSADTIAIVPGEKDSCVVVMDKVRYVNKLNEMIEEGIKNGIYEETEDTTLKDLKRFQDFLSRNFKKNNKYTEMYPSSNQPAKLYGTAKTHKFDKIDDITVESLKFRPIIAQTGTYLYNTAQVISDYLKPLYTTNSYIISNTQDFADLIKNQPPLQDNEQFVSYDVESLFTNVPIHETIDYILEQIHTHTHTHTHTN